ncbi:hypothetical protein [Dyella sp.]|uniref:hypothetical protein n=1 Tax=Dyella sp. TaxID=1869338 RepID=UPI002ED09715
MTEWNRHLFGAMVSPEMYAGLGWCAWQTLQPGSGRAWLPAAVSRDSAEATVLTSGLSLIDQAMDAWCPWIGQYLQQTRAQVDTAIDRWMTGLKSIAGAVATASSCQAEHASAVVRPVRMTSPATSRDRKKKSTQDNMPPLDRDQGTVKPPD